MKDLSTRRPVNKQAAIQMSKGVADPRPSALDFNPSMLINPNQAKFRHKQFVDLTGQVFGRFTVIGLYNKPSGRGHPWVCKCVCGRYELLHRPTLLRGLVDRCRSCDLAQISREGGLPPIIVKHKSQGYVSPTIHPKWRLYSEKEKPSLTPDNLITQRKLTGKRYGKLIVIGLSMLVRGGPNKSLLWVCQCPCGRYVYRPKNTLIDQKGPLCEKCDPV